MSETYDIKKLASHYLALNNAWAKYVEASLLTPWLSVKVGTWDKEVNYLLKPRGIGTIEFRTAKNDKDQDVQQQRVVNHTLEEFIDSPEDVFTINKAIFTKLNAILVFDLVDEHKEFSMYI